LSETRNKRRKLAGTLGLRWNNRQGELAVETKLIKCHEDVVGLRSITVNLAHGARSGSKEFIGELTAVIAFASNGQMKMTNEK